MLSSANEVIVSHDFATTQQHVAKRATELAAKLVYAEHVETVDGQYAILLGVSRPFRGTNLLATVMEGGRHSMFFVRVRDQAGVVSVLATAGGAETVARLDFGRNHDLVSFLLDGLDLA